MDEETKAEISRLEKKLDALKEIKEKHREDASAPAVSEKTMGAVLDELRGLRADLADEEPEEPEEKEPEEPEEKEPEEKDSRNTETKPPSKGERLKAKMTKKSMFDIF